MTEILKRLHFVHIVTVRPQHLTRILQRLIRGKHDGDGFEK